MKYNLKPLVAVLMTVHNSEKTVGEAIESILNQSYKNLEVILVDDASTDSTPKILKSYGKKYQHIRVITLTKNVGPTLAANPGLRSTKGSYIARMDADDLAYPDRIEKQVAFLEKNPRVVILGGQCSLINDDGEIVGEKRFPTRHEEILRAFSYRNPIQHPASMINRKLVPERYLKYDNTYPLADDLDFYLKLSQFGRFANLSSKILFYRNSFQSHSLKNIKKTFFHTLGVRIKAAVAYGYRPSLKGIVLSFCQLILVMLLANKEIYDLFCYLIGVKRLVNPQASFMYDETHGQVS